mmetsp:Transcript_19135/g.55505  ORF Transcript_19135/g.55505 Transcript_19135/m.55505 type:complete len:266 (+) Transcript_19135:248-1045(+)
MERRVGAAVACPCATGHTEDELRGLRAAPAWTSRRQRKRRMSARRCACGAAAVGVFNPRARGLATTADGHADHGPRLCRHQRGVLRAAGSGAGCHGRGHADVPAARLPGCWPRPGLRRRRRRHTEAAAASKREVATFVHRIVGALHGPGCSPSGYLTGRRLCPVGALVAGVHELRHVGFQLQVRPQPHGAFRRPWVRARRGAAAFQRKRCCRLVGHIAAITSTLAAGSADDAASGRLRHLPLSAKRRLRESRQWRILAKPWIAEG